MITLVTVEIYVKIENSKNISMPLSILNPPPAKDGDYLLAKKFIGVILLCSTLEKLSPPTVKKEEPESKNTATRLAPIL